MPGGAGGAPAHALGLAAAAAAPPPVAPAATAAAAAVAAPTRGSVGRTSVAATLAHLRRSGDLASPPDSARRAAAMAEAQTNEAVILTTDGREVVAASEPAGSATHGGGAPPQEGDAVETVAGPSAEGTAGAAARNVPGRVMSADADGAGGWVLWGGGVGVAHVAWTDVRVVPGGEG